MLSSTTNVIVCDVDLNLDGQEFAALTATHLEMRCVLGESVIL